MADISRYLPLSNRPRSDESSVSSDRRDAIGDVIEEAARLIGGVAPARAAALIDAFFDRARLQVTPPAAGGEARARLGAASAAVRSGRPCSIRQLCDAVRALLLLSGDLARTPLIDPRTTGAIALFGATSGPFERRVVLAGHTLRATDGAWEFGRGAVLEGAAIDIAAFVLGVSEIPPQPPPATRPGDAR